jgi:hypothetical protein
MIVSALGQQDGLGNGAKQQENDGVVDMGDGLYANIHAKRARIKAGSGEKMAKKGAEGRPSAQDFKDAAKTAKPQSRKDMIRDKMKDM